MSRKDAQYALQAAKEAANEAKEEATSAVHKAAHAHAEVKMINAVDGFIKKMGIKGFAADDGWTSRWSTECKEYAESASVPFSTLRDRVKKYLQRGEHGKRKTGPKQKLTDLEEHALLAWVDFSRQRFATPTEMEIRAKAGDILSCRGVDSIPGPKWFAGFENKYPDQLQGRKARRIEQHRTAVTAAQVHHSFR